MSAPTGAVPGSHAALYRVGPHPAWGRTDHACAGKDLSLFFAPDGYHESRAYRVAGAIRLCRRCPIVDACREWALAAGPYLHGVYGATSAKERDVIRAERARVGVAA